MISYSLLALWGPEKVQCVPRIVLLTLQNWRGTSRHLKESTIWLVKAMPREALGPGITRKVTLMLSK